LLRFADGSNAAVNYFSNGSKAYDKERVELYRAGHTVVIGNWRSLRSYGFRKDVHARATQDKGHAAMVAAWLAYIKGAGAPPMQPDEVLNTSLATIAASESLTRSEWISL